MTEIVRWPLRVVVDYQFRLGLGLARFGQFTRARASWTARWPSPGTEWCRRLEERLGQDAAEVQADGPIVPPEEAPPIITEVTAWLSRRPRKRAPET